MIGLDSIQEIENELQNIEIALREPQTDERYTALYAAQQALRWAMDPVGFKSPYRTIQLGLCRPIGIQEDSKDYLADIHQGPSLSTHARAD